MYQLSGGKFLRRALLAATALLVGCAGSKSPLMDEALVKYVFIDDLEDMGGQIDWRPEFGAEGTTPGHWDTEAGTQCGNIRPMPSYLGGTWMPAELEEPYETFSGVLSQHAARLYTTEPLVNTWGATLAFDFAKQPWEGNQERDPDDHGDPATCTPPAGVERDSLTPAAQLDLRAFRGVAFYARALPEAGITSVFVKLHDRDTDPRGGVCNEIVGSDDECYNSFGQRVVLDAEFRRYTVDFHDFRQAPGWGYRPPEAVPNLENVFGLVFEIRTPGGACDPPNVCPGALPELSFDVWIDDLAFVER